MGLFYNIAKVAFVSATIAILGGYVYLFKESAAEEALFRQQEPVVVKTIGTDSPFAQTPLRLPLSRETGNEWYHDFVFVQMGSDNIAYFKGGDLYLAKNKDEKQSAKIAAGIGLLQEYLFAFDAERKGNPDIYWIDRNYNLRTLKNSNGKFEDQGVVFNFKNYFKVFPEHIGLGDINLDGKLDMVYGGKIDVGKWQRNVIKALTGTARGFDDFGAVYYLGDSHLKGIVVKDVDGDGDSDLLFMLSENDQEVSGLENIMRTGSNPFVFQTAFKENVSDISPFFGYWFFFMPGGPGHSILFDD